MGTKQFNNYESLLTFTRASGGHALRPVSYGTELVTNGDGSSTDGWTTANTTLSIVSEALRVTATGSSATASQGVSTVVGKVYKFSASLNGGTAVDQIRVGTAINTATGGGSLTSTGEFVFVATTSTTYITLKAGDVSGLYADFDNISVKEVFFDQPDGTLTLFEHPVNVPRVEWDSAGNRLGLLVEEARTNLIPYSEDFSVAFTTTENAGEFQGMPRKLITKTTTSAVAYTNNFTASAGDYTITLVMERGTNRFTSFGLNAGGWIGLARIDWDSMTIATGAGTLQSSSVEILGTGPSGNPVARLTATINVPSAGTVSFYNYLFNSTTTAENLTVYFYHQQLEAGSFPTSYIKSNSGSTTTRSADVASIPVADFGYNQNEGTLFVEWKQSIGAASYVAMLSDGTATNRSMVRQFANGSAYYSTITNSVSQGDILTGTVVDNQSNKIGVVYKHNDAAGVLNGASAVTDATFLVPEGVSTLSIGSYTVGSSQYINGHIKKLMYIPRRVTNAQLISLTE